MPNDNLRALAKNLPGSSAMAGEGPADRVFAIEQGGRPLYDHGVYGAGDISLLARPGQTVDGLSYAYSSIGAVISGEFNYMSAKGVISAHPGVVLFGDFGEEFSFTYETPEKLRRVVVAFDRDLLLETAEATGSPTAFPEAGINHGERQVQLYGALRRLACLRQPYDELALRALVLAFGATGRAEVAMCNAQRDTMRAIARHITDTCAEPWDLATMARLAGVSRYRFIRRFSAAIGETPRQHLIGARMRLAADQLTDGSDKVTNIALSVGFNDISHFNHTFLRTFGCSPRTWLAGPKARCPQPRQTQRVQIGHLTF